MPEINRPKTIDQIANKLQATSNAGHDTIRIPVADMYQLLEELRQLQTAIMPFVAVAERYMSLLESDNPAVYLPVPASAYKKCIWLNNTKIA